MKNRIISAMAALALTAAGVVGVAATATPAAAVNTTVCFNSPSSAGIGIRIQYADGTWWSTTGGCKSGSFVKICAPSSRAVWVNSSHLAKGACQMLLSGASYHVRVA